MATLAACFSWAIKKLREFGAPLWTRVCLLAFLALFPESGYMSIVTVKDVQFAMICVIFFIKFIEYFRNPEKFGKKGLALLGFIAFNLCIWRHNGAWVFWISVPFFIALFKGNRKKTAIIAAWAAGFLVAFQGVLTVVNPDKERITESMSVPLMQMFKVVKDHGDTLTNDEKVFFYTLISQDPNSPNHAWYTRHLSDFVKRNVNEDMLKEEAGKAFALYVKLGMAHPAEYLAAALDLNIFEWYPDADAPLAGIYQTYIDRSTSGIPYEGAFGQQVGEGTSKWPSLMKFFDKIWPWAWVGYVPIIGHIFCPAFTIYLLLLTFVAFMLKRDKACLLGIPFTLMWLTTLISPTTTGRYNYPYVVLSLVAVIMLFSPRKNAETEEKVCKIS
jgi:hypothetical protein